jgi:maleylacetoacetate isomerase
MKAKLYQYWRSSASWRVRWALAIKRIEFETVVVNIVGGEQKADEHRARNPIGHVPALTIDGHTLAESVAIIEYLEDRTPTPALYPRDSYARTRVRQMVECVNSGMQPMQNLVVLGRLSSDGAVQKEWAKFFNERGLAAFERLIEESRKEFGPGRFAHGDSLTAADVFLVPQVYSARRFGADLAQFPRVLEVEKNALATEFATGALPDNQPGAPAPK